VATGASPSSREAAYVRIATPNGTAVVLAPLVPAFRDVLGRGTLYDYAAAHPERHAFPGGRGVAYAVPLGEARAVVRHARHGGALAALTRDLFLAPTRAPYELAVSVQLRARQVRTPEILGYVTYPALPVLRRVDVVTREVRDAVDLGTVLARLPGERVAVWAAVTALVDAMCAAGAYHADLNVGNIVLTREGHGGYAAHVLDVDRVVWRRAGDPAVGRANLRRLGRSIDKVS
jgi:hypothetical protein